MLLGTFFGSYATKEEIFHNAEKDIQVQQVVEVVVHGGFCPV